eukprot:10827675-Ditylum_brightwellii.AAC.1
MREIIHAVLSCIHILAYQSPKMSAILSIDTKEAIKRLGCIFDKSILDNTLYNSPTFSDGFQGVKSQQCGTQGRLRSNQNSSTDMVHGFDIKITHEEREELIRKERIDGRIQIL